MNKLILAPDEEIRTEMVRLYLEQEHPALLNQMQYEVRGVTNHIVRSRRDVKDAVVAYAKRHGLCGEAPKFPQKPNLHKPQGPEDNVNIKEAWSEYDKVQKVAIQEYSKWLDQVFKSVKGIPECEWRKDTYQGLRSIYGRISSAVLIRDTTKRVMQTKHAKSKKPSDHVPLVFGNSSLIQTGEFYGTRRGVPWYDARVRVPMGKGIGELVILGRLRRPLPGKPIQGVTLTKKADGWYATVKCIVKKRILPEATMPPVGVDVGQTDLVTLSDGYKERNIRDAEFVALKAAIQESGGPEWRYQRSGE